MSHRFEKRQVNHRPRSGRPDLSLCATVGADAPNRPNCFVAWAYSRWRLGAAYGDERNPKVVPSCALPPTGKAVVDRIITYLAVIDIARHDRAPIVRELVPGVSLDERVKATGAAFDTTQCR